jgi:hypothetical protein
VVILDILVIKYQKADILRLFGSNGHLVMLGYAWLLNDYRIMVGLIVPKNFAETYSRTSGVELAVC